MKPFRLSVPLTVTSSGVLAFIVYVAMSSPGHLVVSERGEILGIVNVARAKLQGVRFWKEQLREAKIELKWSLAAPHRDAERNARIDALMTRTDQRLHEIYERYPKARPSPAEQKAEALREEADRIEQAELDQILEQRRLTRIADLEKIIQILESQGQLDDKSYRPDAQPVAPEGR